MLEDTLDELERRVLEQPEDPDLLLELLHAARHAGRLGELFRTRSLPPALYPCWGHFPGERDLEVFFLTSLGLESVSREEGKPGLWWSQQLRIAEYQGRFHDPRTGFPLVVRRSRDGARMNWVPPGISPEEGDEGSRATTGGFYLDTFPVTVGRFRRFLEATGRSRSRRLLGQEDYPVVSVTWEEARAYGEWAGGALPTTQEWLVAARGSDGRTYPWGDESPDRSRCNWFHDEGQGDRYAFMDQRVEAISRRPGDESPFGVRGLAGNVSDWCQDEILGAEGRSLRAWRGGNFHSWSWSDLACEPSGDRLANPGQGLDTLGFRLAVRVLPPPRDQEPR